MPSETVEKVIAKIRANRERFETFCRSLTDEELSRLVPGSTLTDKDFIIHLDSLDPELVRWFEATAAGTPDVHVRNPDGARFDIDDWNERVVSERRDWPLDRILAEASGNREALIESLERLGDEQIEMTYHFSGDNKRPPADVSLKLFLQGWSRHDPIHVADMVKALPERAEDPDIKQWLDDSIVKWYQTAMAGPAIRG